MAHDGARRVSGSPDREPKASPGPPEDITADGPWPSGLGAAEAAKRLAAEGPNELPFRKERNLAAIVWEVARQPMLLLLAAGGALYLVMGEPRDAFMLLGFVFVVVAITAIQERRTERALERLRDLSSPRALVIRDGKPVRIPGREVVRGDLLILQEGARVPADAIVRGSDHLHTDESLLTGESVPVRKTASAEASGLEPPGGDDLSSVYSGTLVTAGRGLAEVAATGADTRLGGIGRALERMEVEATPLQVSTGRLVRLFALVGLALSAAVVVLFAWSRGGGAAVWKEGFLAGIAMAMSVLPEEIPVVLTVFLALGAWRISRSRVLTRRMPAVETLGAATVLCVDKTGTLTRNRMTLTRLAAEGSVLDPSEDGELPEPFRELVEYGILASRSDPFDPMELALHAMGDKIGAAGGGESPARTPLREYPLTDALLAVGRVWERKADDSAVAAFKGAPEAVARLCRMTADRREAFLRDVEAMADEGLRVLAVARAEVDASAVPDDPLALEFEFLGLLGFEDPLRPGVPEAVAECRNAGIRVVMITGDHPATARTIARRAGFPSWAEVIAGSELERMADDELARRARSVGVFARVAPEQKLRIVNALKAAGEVVAMTGDGVNDAPALKASHIGVAMGGRGTDVAREAASLVLLDDDFTSIVAAVRLGRRIFDNIRKAVAFTFAVHVPIAGLCILPVFFSDWPLLLLPVHIVFLEMIIDPSCALVFEAEAADPGVMSRPPRKPGERLFTRRALGFSLLQGGSVLLVCVGAYELTRGTHGAEEARALTFAALVAGAVAMILVNRSWTKSAVASLRDPNPALWYIFGGTAVMLGAVLTVPALRRFFHFAPIPAGDVALAVAGSFLCLAWYEVLKFWRTRDKLKA